MLNEICNPNSHVHYYLFAGVFLWEHLMGKTKFGSTIGALIAPFKKEK